MGNLTDPNHPHNPIPGKPMAPAPVPNPTPNPTPNPNLTPKKV
jgi:hypothetical protein